MKTANSQQASPQGQCCQLKNFGSENFSFNDENLKKLMSLPLRGGAADKRRRGVFKRKKFLNKSIFTSQSATLTALLKESLFSVLSFSLQSEKPSKLRAFLLWFTY
ncbi:MAG: hypothetical protein LUG66_01745 [Clostridiales bacterium]|nr:hypothetical protein [Clostridiales bacterium]